MEDNTLWVSWGYEGKGDTTVVVEEKEEDGCEMVSSVSPGCELGMSSEPTVVDP